MRAVPEPRSWSLTTRGWAGQVFCGVIWCFPSGRGRAASLEVLPVPKWRNGRRRGFKIPRWQHRVSSNLTLGTTYFCKWLISAVARWRGHAFWTLRGNRGARAARFAGEWHRLCFLIGAFRRKCRKLTTNCAGCVNHGQDRPAMFWPFFDCFTIGYSQALLRRVNRQSLGAWVERMSNKKRKRPVSRLISYVETIARDSLCKCGASKAS